ncbi:YsnF/AvaK domain-containing protein [Pyxidicoccus fallax]|uniref:YsnF/AvaK domain-containing protein n=1 Tax=Pyxidicoccus fallax TaxID=394095 RepID=A0A848L7C7_9BACT|nr:YsnF/AvaK domain-containing protein [Pyxidicoccus fallax]NMO14476.1 YsnF/AvaK domain-containing protein [Pyxidicoccus fallax]NPC77870.1 YsnF/AvaK domain-containing protein [Pyxidicoccus fallax]
MFQRSDVREGMIVRSVDGEKLGKVFAVGDGEFHIEKGLFFPKDYLVRYSEISDIRGGEIILNHGKEALRGLSGDNRYDAGATAGLGGGAGVGPGAVGVPATGSTTTGYGATGLGTSADTLSGSGLGRDTNLGASASANLGTERTMTGRSEDIAIPVHKEELDVLKRERQAGEVRVRKDVIEEEKVVDVPVRRERVRVERRDVTPDRPAMNASFQEETIVVPLRAEEVEVQKRAVVDEEVVIHKDAIEEERRVAESVRREDVDIRTDGDVEGGSRTLGAPSDDPLKRGY